MKINISGIDQTIRRIDNILKTTSSLPMDKVTDYAEKTFRYENFSFEGGKTKKWQALKPSTLAQKRRLGFGGKGILVRTGSLQNSVYKKSTKNKAEFGFTKYYAPVHQYGSPKKNIPKRLLISAEREFVQNVKNIVQKEIDIVIK